MFTLSDIIIHLLEGVAITFAIHIVTRRALKFPELITLILSITTTFMILDLFAPAISPGARQGTGFGIGLTQIAGDGTFPSHYFSQNNQLVEGMDDPTALNYYSQYNPKKYTNGDVQDGPNHFGYKIINPEQTPSIILQEYSQNVFGQNQQNLAPIQ